jgi:hypothetical protein
MKNLYLYLILALTAIYFYCYEYHSCSFVEGYRNAEVYIGQNLKSSNHNILFMNDDSNFGWHSIYETGEVINPDNKKYPPIFGNVYGSSYAGYYDYS